MGVFEARRILQTESEHPIQADVSGPDQRKKQRLTVVAPNRVAAERQRPDVRVHSIVDHAPDARARHIADHRNVGHKKEQDEFKPAAMVPAVRQNAQDENGGAFKLQEGLRVHGFHVAPR